MRYWRRWMVISWLATAAAGTAWGQSIFDNGLPVVVAGQQCGPGQAVTGVDANAALICDCFPGLTDCGSGCFDHLTTVDHCGACDRSCASSLAGGGPCIGGVCRPCDLVFQDCPVEGEACFVLLSDPPDSFCAEPGGFSGDGMQGDDCMFLNGCAEGYGCVLPNEVVGSTGLECARFCDPGNPGGANGDARCVADAGAGFRCVRATDFYSDVPASASYVGFCIGPEWP